MDTLSCQLVFPTNEGEVLHIKIVIKGIQAKFYGVVQFYVILNLFSMMIYVYNLLQQAGDFFSGLFHGKKSI